MRRIRTEWLLVPLFLAPVIACAGYAMWAQSSREADLRRMIATAPGLVAQSVEGERGNFHARPQRVPGAIEVVRMTRFYSLTLRADNASDVEWTIGTAFPQGAPASSLASDDGRAQLESGVPAAQLATSYAGARLRQFAAAYREPTIEAIRALQLPAPTLLFLLDRLPTDAVVPEGREKVRLALRRIAALQLHGEPEGQGLHRTRDGLVLRYSSGPRFMMELLPDDARLEFRERDLGESVTVVYGDRPAPGAVWSAELETPARGTWSIVPRHAGSWWSVPRYRRGIGPVVVGALAYTLVLGALAVAMWRRRQLDEARARFLTEIAHDLRTPLTSVRLHAELLASPKKKADREGKYLGVLTREAARASDLLANLLDLSRLDRGQRVYNPEARRLFDLVEPCVREFRQLYPSRADDLACNGDPDLEVVADASALQRCITNLLDNAGKYTPDGTGIRLSWSVSDYVVIRVEDDGPGVPEADRGRLFERYARGSRIEGIAGTGLGLSLVKELVEGMGGTVQYRAGAPGACFEIRLRGGDRA